MSSPRVLDLTRLLAPIPGENPAGCDPRVDTRRGKTFQALKLARSAARTAERQLATGDDEAKGVRPNWRPVLELAVGVISEQAKDLEAAAYLVEALARLHGFAGLRDGFCLCRGLVE